MANYQNHVIDPTFFYDAIEMFSFDYDIYVYSNIEIDDYGKQKITYKFNTIRGSLQTQGSRLSQSKKGNTNVTQYEFYCKSLYRINIGDVIHYKNNWLRCIGVHEYDEYGVREATLEMINLTEYRDLKDYVEYLGGAKII